METLGRRNFLGLGLAGVSTLGGVRRVFARKLETMAGSPLSEASFEAMRRHYTLASEVTYFNHASIGTMPTLVREALQKYLEICESNPWRYMWGGDWDEARERARRRASQLLGCDPAECALTHNTTEGFNLLAAGLPLKRGDEVLFSSLNHPGASVCWFHQSRTRGFTVRRFDFPLSKVPTFTAGDLLNTYQRQIRPQTRVLVFPHVDNSVGLRYPVKEMAELARSRGVEFVAVDGAQAVGMIPVNVKEMGVDFYATSAHKWIQAPKGLGLLYVRKEVRDSLRPMWVTWGQERWAASARIYEDYGTRNLAETLALGDALAFQKAVTPEARETRLRALREHFRRGVARTPRLEWRSSDAKDLISSIYAVEIKGTDSRKVFERMYRQWGFVFRPFSTPHLNTLRISPNVFNTEKEMDRFFELVAKV
ncbi:MAG: aminotransferase class V-fold PLP-dependent enzyme [Acidobacteriota bacterium]